MCSRCGHLLKFLLVYTWGQWIDRRYGDSWRKKASRLKSVLSNEDSVGLSWFHLASHWVRRDQSVGIRREQVILSGNPSLWAKCEEREYFTGECETHSSFFHLSHVQYGTIDKIIGPGRTKVGQSDSARPTRTVSDFYFLSDFCPTVRHFVLVRLMSDFFTTFLIFSAKLNGF